MNDNLSDLMTTDDALARMEHSVSGAYVDGIPRVAIDTKDLLVMIRELRDYRECDKNI